VITAVTTCMGRREHLEITLPLMLDEFERVIVVDWSCPQFSGEWAAKQGAEVVYQTNQKHFNASKAKNIGARYVEGRSVCFIDADTLAFTGLRQEIEKSLTLTSMILARRPGNVDVTGLNGFIAVDIGHFWGVGGYDETLEGYALEDAHLRARLCLERQLSPIRVSSLGAIRHANEMRSLHHKELISVSSKRSYDSLTRYLKTHGIQDWITDPRTSEIAYRNASD
jgi:glycosyltransferase involved in cell wall biosynthesis